MKPIELTKEHRKKLIIMTNKLFPEYKYCVIQNDEILLSKEYYVSSEEFDNQLNNEKLIIFHWLEFCLIQIRKKLKIHHNEFYRTNIGIKDSVHIIDYIYEKFIK